MKKVACPSLWVIKPISKINLKHCEKNANSHGKYTFK
jgi:hypothetical protein